MATEDRGVGVNHDAVFERRVPLAAANQIAVAVGGKAQRTKRHALIQLHVLADIGRFADHDARAVIDEEVLADLRAGWMSMPVRLWAHSVIMRGMNGISSSYSTWAKR